MEITVELTDASVLEILGARVKAHRIEANLTQAELSEQAGVSKRTLERIESGQGSELVTLIRLLRILGLIDRLDRLVPEITPGPIAQLESRGKRRKRVAHARGKAARDQPQKPARPWTWGKE